MMKYAEGTLFPEMKLQRNRRFEDFGGNGNYSNPEFIWYDTVAPPG